MYSTYAINRRTYTLNHYRRNTMLLGDYAEQPHPELDALARSGDYFITLATKLDTIAAELPEVSITTSSLLLSRLAQELEYLQHHYELNSKPTDRLRYHAN